MTFREESFEGLNSLIKLELIECSTLVDKLYFDSLTNLQFLSIQDLRFTVDLKPLENLKVLVINGMDDFCSNSLEHYLVNLSESITNIQLSSLNMDMSKADLLFSRLNLPNLSYLRIHNNQLSCIKEQWFKPNVLLKELILYVNNLEKLDFCRFDRFSHLEKLDISGNLIEKLDEAAFSKLKRLKWLDLGYNPILDLGSNKFLGLKNLETLILEKINELGEFNRIEKDAFNGLTNLKKLSLSENHLSYIDPEVFIHTPKLNILSLNYNRLESIDPNVFSHTPKLVKLKICDNKMRIEENIFSNLKYLKRIKLCKTDLEYIKEDLFENLKKSKIEFNFKY